MSVEEPAGFEPIWQAIKGWDIQREHGAGYHGPTGDDVRTILAALRAAGYAVVPVDATEAQTRAAAHLDWNAQIDPTWGEIYRVMIAAAEDT